MYNKLYDYLNNKFIIFVQQFNTTRIYNRLRIYSLLRAPIFGNEGKVMVTLSYFLPLNRGFVSLIYSQFSILILILHMVE